MAASRFGRDQAMAACARLPDSQLTHPFGETSEVFKVSGKMFAVVSMADDPAQVTLKCDPGYAAALVQQHDDITPGYHTNKRHWVTVTMGGSVPGTLIKDLIGDSYDLVVATLPVKARPRV